MGLLRTLGVATTGMGFFGTVITLTSYKKCLKGSIKKKRKMGVAYPLVLTHLLDIAFCFHCYISPGINLIDMILPWRQSAHQKGPVIRGYVTTNIPNPNSCKKKEHPAESEKHSLLFEFCQIRTPFARLLRFTTNSRRKGISLFRQTDSKPFIMVYIFSSLIFNIVGYRVYYV